MKQIKRFLALLLSFAAQSFTHAVFACGIFFTLWAVYTVYLFRRKLFKKRYADRPAIPWQEEE